MWGFNGILINLCSQVKVCIKLHSAAVGSDASSSAVALIGDVRHAHSQQEG